MNVPAKLVIRFKKEVPNPTHLKDIALLGSAILPNSVKLWSANDDQTLNAWLNLDERTNSHFFTCKVFVILLLHFFSEMGVLEIFPYNFC